jgi:hypothetical protein
MLNGNESTPIKLYHIVHISKLSASVSDGCLLSDAEVRKRPVAGETIGMGKIKRRRLEELTLSSHPGLYIGECVPFYFCPRSVMLYLLHRGNHPEVEYRGGQEQIVHLMFDLHKVVEWADSNRLRWAFTTSNAGSRYFEDYADLRDLDKIDWRAVKATNWSDPQIKEKKQSEFLVERFLPWSLVEGIGVHNPQIVQKLRELQSADLGFPLVKAKPDWYY